MSPAEYASWKISTCCLVSSATRSIRWHLMLCIATRRYEYSSLEFAWGAADLITGVCSVWRRIPRGHSLQGGVCVLVLHGSTSLPTGLHALFKLILHWVPRYTATSLVWFPTALITRISFSQRSGYLLITETYTHTNIHMYIYTELVKYIKLRTGFRKMMEILIFLITKQLHNMHKP